MKDQQSVRLEQALDNVSGVMSNRKTGASNVGQSATMIRGFQTYEFYRDGSRFSGAWVTNGPREMANIERVEALKGSASILYGRVEPGGIVNLVTKQPQATPYYSLQQQIGSYDFYRTTIDATGSMNKDDSLLYRVNFAYENGGSFREFVNNDRVFLAPTFHWTVSDKTQVNTHFEYQHNTGTSDTGLFAVGNRPVDLPRERNLGEAGAKFESETFVAGFDWSHAFNDNWTLRHRFDATFVLKNNGTGGLYPWDETNCTPASCPVQRYALTNKSPANVYYTTLDLQGKFNTWVLKHTLLFGTDYQRLDNRYRFQFNFAGPKLNNAYNPIHTGIDPNIFALGSTGGFNLTQEWFGFYAQDQIELPYHLHLLARFRYDKARNTEHNLNGGNNVMTNATADVIKPRFGILYQPIPEVSVYGNYVQNFGLPSGGTNVEGEGKPLAPTTAEQWEAGMKTELFDKRLTTTLAWFDITKQNIATTDPKNFGSQEAIGEVRNRGIELDMTGELLPSWKLIGNYSYIDAKITKDHGVDATNNTLTQGNQGNRLWNVPRNSGSLWTTYEFEQGDLQGLKLGVGMIARDQRQGDKINSFQLSGYTTVNLMTSYSMKLAKSKLTAQLNVNNLLDKHYYDSSAGWSDRTTGILAGTPLNFMGSVKLEF